MTKASSLSGKNSSSKNLVRLTTAALAIAIVFLFTFLVKVPTVIGYIHLGDAFILLYAAATGDPLALLVGALGEGLADFAGGYYQYVPATMLIKALVALPVYLTARKERTAGHNGKVLTKPVFLSTLPSIVITLGGYFLTDWILFGAYAYAALWTNAVQAIASILLFVVMAKAIEKSALKSKL